MVKTKKTSQKSSKQDQSVLQEQEKELLEARALVEELRKQNEILRIANKRAKNSSRKVGESDIQNVYNTIGNLIPFYTKFTNDNPNSEVAPIRKSLLSLLTVCQKKVLEAFPDDAEMCKAGYELFLKRKAEQIRKKKEKDEAKKKLGAAVEPPVVINGAELKELEEDDENDANNDHYSSEDLQNAQTSYQDEDILQEERRKRPRTQD